MTAFRLVDLEEPKVAEVLQQMERFQPIGHAILNKTGVIQVGGKFKWPRGMPGHRKSLANALKLVSPILSRCSPLPVETENNSSAFPRRREHANTRSLKKEHTAVQRRCILSLARAASSAGYVGKYRAWLGKSRCPGGEGGFERKIIRVEEERVNTAWI